MAHQTLNVTNERRLANYTFLGRLPYHGRLGMLDGLGALATLRYASFALGRPTVYYTRLPRWQRGEGTALSLLVGQGDAGGDGWTASHAAATDGIRGARPTPALASGTDEVGSNTTILVLRCWWLRPPVGKPPRVARCGVAKEPGKDVFSRL